MKLIYQLIKWQGNNLVDTIIILIFVLLLNVKPLKLKDMETKASIVVMSHLSDVSFLSNKKEMNERMNFVKFIILNTDGDLNKQINPDRLWDEFKEIFPD